MAQSKEKIKEITIPTVNHDGVMVFDASGPGQRIDADGANEFALFHKILNEEIQPSVHDQVKVNMGYAAFLNVTQINKIKQSE